jgi:tRNA(fMet)-specific endonuclease VapC
VSAVILDTDHLSLVLRQAQCPLLDKLDQVPPDDVATTIVSFQEQVQGWLAYLQGARGDVQILRAYEELDALLRWFAKMTVLAFDQEAQNCFHSRGSNAGAWALLICVLPVLPWRPTRHC